MACPCLLSGGSSSGGLSAWRLVARCLVAVAHRVVCLAACLPGSRQAGRPIYRPVCVLRTHQLACVPRKGRQVARSPGRHATWRLHERTARACLRLPRLSRLPPSCSQLLLSLVRALAFCAFVFCSRLFLFARGFRACSPSLVSSRLVSSRLVSSRLAGQITKETKQSELSKTQDQDRPAPGSQRQR